MSPKAGYLSLILIGLLAFCNAIRHPFVHDDVAFIVNNPHISQLNHWYQAFEYSTTSVDVNPYYRPFLEVIYRLEYHFFRFNPYPYHLMNILIHIINGLLVFRLMAMLGLKESQAWVIAVLFLIHPVQTEAVSCVAGISNLCMSLGVLLALIAHIKRWEILSAVFFVLAFFSKEQAVLFIPLVMVIDCARNQRNYMAWIVWIFTGASLMWLRQCVTGANLMKDVMQSPGELILRLQAIPRDIEMYLRLIFVPYDLHYYRNTDILQPNLLSWIIGLSVIVAIIFFLRRWPRDRRVLYLGFGWFLAALLPVLNVAPLINEYSFILTAEHFLYLPMIGILIVTVIVGDYYLKDAKKIILYIALAACLLLTWHQNAFWQSEVALFERMIEFEPNFGRGHWLLARAYYTNGNLKAAELQYKQAFSIIADYEHKAANVQSRKYYQQLQMNIYNDWTLNQTLLKASS